MASDPKAAVRDLLLVLVAFVAVGAAAGWLWHAIWAPAPEATGFLISNGKPVFAGESYIRASGLYVLLAAGVGVVLGAAAAWFADRDEVLTLAGVVLGAVAGGRVMAEVGTRLGPDEPPAKVTSSEQLAGVVAALQVEEVLVWTVMPAAAVAGALAVLLIFAKRHVQDEFAR